MNPILDSLIKDARKLDSMRDEMLNAHSKLWRLQEKYFKTLESFGLTLVKFTPYIDKEVLNEPK